MKGRYIKLIADLDAVLSLVRLMWLQADNAEERLHYRNKIDALLDNASNSWRKGMQHE